MLSENSVDWKPCWWKNNGDDNSLRVKTVEMLNMLRVKSNRLVDRKPMWCKTVEILWQCWLNPTPPNRRVGLFRRSVEVQAQDVFVPNLEQFREREREQFHSKIGFVPAAKMVFILSKIWLFSRIQIKCPLWFDVKLE